MDSRSDRTGLYDALNLTKAATPEEIKKVCLLASQFKRLLHVFTLPLGLS
jgi:hypothetical protein